MKRHIINLAVMAALSGAVPAWADEPLPFPEFTFKRVGLPNKGSTGRIRVQIDPAEQQAALTEAKPAAPEAPEMPVSGYEWFWGVVSADISRAGPENVNRALSELEKAVNLPQPRLQHMQDLAAMHGIDIIKATIGTEISPALVVALISVESAGRTDAVSSAGAEGLMQLIPATAERFGVTDSADAADNIKGGVAYLSWLMNHFDQDPILALAGYNAGENAVAKHKGVPPYSETRAYVPKVLNAWRVARALCKTPPELVSDGCVFALSNGSGNG